MPRMPIDFRDLLERVLPLEELPPLDRAHVQRALRSGVARQVEAAAMHAIARLEQGGALRRVEDETGAPVRRYVRPAGSDVITVELPTPTERGGVFIYPRAGLPSDVAAGLDEVRRLLRLDDPVYTESQALPDARQAQLQQLDLAGRALLGADHVRFVPAPGPNHEPDAAEHAVDAGLVAEAEGRPGSVFWCPDTALSPRLAAAAHRGVAAAAWCAVGAADGSVLGALEAQLPAGRVLDGRDLARLALLADAFGTVLERAARIERLVFVDPLTGSYNRSYFELQARNELARAEREGESMALCIADVDDFKSFNTTYGYDAGNQVLIQVAQTLRRGVRPFDTVARWGGEEFVVLLTAPVDETSVGAISERLRAAVERLSLRLEGLDGLMYATNVTVSIGVALSPRHGRTVPELWRTANQALLEAKRRQKNRVVIPGAGGD